MENGFSFSAFTFSIMGTSSLLKCKELMYAQQDDSEHFSSAGDTDPHPPQCLRGH